MMRAVAIIGLAAVALAGHAAMAGAPFPEPPAEAPAQHGSAVAVLAGGCFWGMEGVFEHVRGVSQVTAGYAGGTAATANYDAVSAETTQHAEAVRIIYDPAVVSYGTLLKVYFSVAHDPTEVEGQAPDYGHSYRSAIFPQDAAQRGLAAAYIASLTRAHLFRRPIATHLETGNFYPAETYHQHFLRDNPRNPYIAEFDMPKLEALRRRLPQLYR